MILHLIRHPRPRIASGICYGQLDISAENPTRIAAKLRQKIPATVPLWSSPLQRCRSLAKALHPAPCFDDRLMEMNFGRWEGRPWDDVARQELDTWAADLLHYAPPGGESAAQLQQRLLDFLAHNATEEMVLVTHAGVIRTLLALFNERSLRDFLHYPVAYGEMLSLSCARNISELIPQ